jgi:hypothetical protein
MNFTPFMRNGTAAIGGARRAGPARRERRARTSRSLVETNRERVARRPFFPAKYFDWGA